jgi:hypothetical protein
MKSFLRRLRGIIGTGLTWAAGFVGISVVRFVLFGVPWEAFPELATQWAILGFVTGGAFAGILSLTERSRTLEDLSLHGPPASANLVAPPYPQHMVLLGG